jgi:hypothetical protein
LKRFFFHKAIEWDWISARPAKIKRLQDHLYSQSKRRYAQATNHEAPCGNSNRIPGDTSSRVDLPTVKRISGHETLKRVERYEHQNGAHIQTAKDKLEERIKIWWETLE